MKKFLMILGSFVLSCVLHADIVSDCMEQCAILRKSPSAENLAAAENFVNQTFSKATNDKEKTNLLFVQKRINAGKGLTFAQHKEVMDAKIQAANFSKVTDSFRFTCYYVPRHDAYYQPVYELFKQNPGSEKGTADIAGTCAKLTGHYDDAIAWYLANNQIGDAAIVYTKYLNDPVKGLSCAQKIVERSYSAKQVSTVVSLIERFFIGNPKVSPSEVKELLQNINRKYSSKMIANPTAWKPVITRVRTLIETF